MVSLRIHKTIKKIIKNIQNNATTRTIGCKYVVNLNRTGERNRNSARDSSSDMVINFFIKTTSAFGSSIIHVAGKKTYQNIRQVFLKFLNWSMRNTTFFGFFMKVSVQSNT